MICTMGVRFVSLTTTCFGDITTTMHNGAFERNAVYEID
jgi:hypothetical protein